jgi:hypothetical protein
MVLDVTVFLFGTDAIQVWGHRERVNRPAVQKIAPSNMAMF